MSLKPVFSPPKTSKWPNPSPLLDVSKRSEWRAWLRRNYKTAGQVWLVFYKKHTGRPRVAYNDAVEEALAFGWIDSTAKKVDEDRYAQRFTPRRPRQLLFAGEHGPAPLHGREGKDRPRGPGQGQAPSRRKAARSSRPISWPRSRPTARPGSTSGPSPTPTSASASATSRAPGAVRRNSPSACAISWRKRNRTASSDSAASRSTTEKTSPAGSSPELHLHRELGRMPG